MWRFVLRCTIENVLLPALFHSVVIRWFLNHNIFVTAQVVFQASTGLESIDEDFWLLSDRLDDVPAVLFGG
jgi:hypothetical protein